MPLRILHVQAGGNGGAAECTEEVHEGASGARGADDIEGARGKATNGLVMHASPGDSIAMEKAMKSLVTIKEIGGDGNSLHGGGNSGGVDGGFEVERPFVDVLVRATCRHTTPSARVTFLRETFI